MLKILVTYAVQGEFVEIKWPDVEPYYVRTGIGKVKSAFHLAEAIRQVQPDLVLNMGSAGTPKPSLSTWRTRTIYRKGMPTKILLWYWKV